MISARLPSLLQSSDNGANSQAECWDSFVNLANHFIFPPLFGRNNKKILFYYKNKKWIVEIVQKRNPWTFSIGNTGSSPFTTRKAIATSNVLIPLKVHSIYFLRNINCSRKKSFKGTYFISFKWITTLIYLTDTIQKEKPPL